MVGTGSSFADKIMKISRKLNIGFIVACFLPLCIFAGYSLWYFSQRLDYEADARLQADLATAKLLYEAELTNLENLAAYIAGNQSFRMVVKFELESQLATLLDDYGRQHQLSNIGVKTRGFLRLWGLLIIRTHFPIRQMCNIT